jgi:hypothetical protein
MEPAESRFRSSHYLARPVSKAAGILSAQGRIYHHAPDHGGLRICDEKSEYPMVAGAIVLGFFGIAVFDNGSK